MVARANHYDFCPGTTSEIMKVFLGRYLGAGISRKVYQFRPDPLYVVKVEYKRDDNVPDFQNIAEWTLWCEAKPRLRKWLAPCWWLSPNGVILIQRRCFKLRGALPKDVPPILADKHRGNWGMHDGRPVLIDYGRNHVMDLAAANEAMERWGT